MRRDISCTRFFAGTARLPLALVYALMSPCVSVAQLPPTISVTGMDYAFQAPDSVRAGPVIFAFVNRGTVRHEMFLFRLRTGRTLADMLRATDPQERRALTDQTGGVLFADGGQPSSGRLLVELAPGRTYALLCFLQDSADSPRHHSLGMAKSLHAKR